MKSDDAFSLYVPTRIHFGKNAWRTALAAEHALLRGNLLVVSTGRSLRRLGYLPALMDELRKLRDGREALQYDAVSANPKLDEVTKAVAMGKARQIDTIIGFGGGSAMDAAKAVAAGIGSDACVQELLLKGIAPTEKTPKILAIPTTAGTGSELSKGAILSSLAHHIKTGIRGEHIYPTVAIVDSSFTYHVPYRITMETGFDVLAHAIESYVSRKAMRFSERISEDCIRIVGENLPRLAANIEDHEARDAMMYASMIVGINLGNVGTALPHRMQYPIGARTDTSHGAGLMALYPAWLAHEYSYAEERLERAASLLMRKEIAGREQTLGTFTKFIAGLGVRQGLRVLGIEGIAAEHLASEVTGSLANDPAFSETDVITKIYQESMQ